MQENLNWTERHSSGLHLTFHEATIGFRQLKKFIQEGALDEELVQLSNFVKLVSSYFKMDLSKQKAASSLGSALSPWMIKIYAEAFGQPN